MRTMLLFLNNKVAFNAMALFVMEKMTLGFKLRHIHNPD